MLVLPTDASLRISSEVRANGHSCFLLPVTYTQAAGPRGMAEFVVPQGGRISAIGIRATPTGTRTTIPMLVR